MNNIFIAETATRVPDHTSQEVNNRIRQETVRRLQQIGSDSRRIDMRLRELDREWDIERAIEANASTLLLMTLALGATVDKKWIIFSGIIAGFLLQHSIQGWCPPVPVLRQLGFRTQREIDDERAVLLARRGAFDRMDGISSDQALSKLDAQPRLHS